MGADLFARVADRGGSGFWEFWGEILGLEMLGLRGFGLGELGIKSSLIMGFPTAPPPPPYTTP